jgi:ribosome silencing factor RsfS/YbeB/iojap
LVLGSGPGARRLRHRHPCGQGTRRHGREEGAIARTPKTTETTPAPKAKAAATPRSAAAKAKPAAAKAKPAATKAPAATAKPAATKATPAAKAKPAVATHAPAKPKAATKPAAGKAKAATPKPDAPVAKPKPARAAAKAAPAPKAAPARKPAAKAAATTPAAPRPARGKKREKLPPDRLALLVDAAIKSLEDDKAENIVLLDVTGRADYADRLIIATGLVERQLQAMATHLDEALAKAGLHLRRDNIQASGDWVLIDAGDLVIHLFRPEARELYRLERMWGPESPGAADAPPG